MSVKGQMYQTGNERPAHPDCGTPSQNMGRDPRTGARRFRCPRCRRSWRERKVARPDPSLYDDRTRELGELIRLGWGEVPGPVIEEIRGQLGTLPECPQHLARFEGYQCLMTWAHHARLWISARAAEVA